MASDWNVAVLYRRYHPDHSKSVAERALRLVQVMHEEHGPYSHVELLFRLPCGGGVHCPSRKHGTPRPMAHFHRVAYSTSWTQGRCYRTVDREYKVTRDLWDMQRFRIDDKERLVAMLNFLDSQLDTRFGLSNLVVNFTLGSVVRREPLPFGRLKPRVDNEDRFVAAPPLKRRKAWFCSELVCACLIIGGVIIDDRISPCVTSPQILRECYKRFAYEQHPVPMNQVDVLQLRAVQ